MPLNHRLGRVALALVLVAAAAWGVSHRAEIDPRAAMAWVRDAGPWLPIVFVLLHVPASLLFLPRFVTGIAAGVLFGPWWGTFLTLFGSTLGATIGFLAARYVGADWLAGTTRPRLHAALARIEAEGFRLVLLLRLIPIMPHAGVNYGLALTRIAVWPFIAASAIGMLPSALIHAYLGHVGGLAAEGGDWAMPLLWALCLLAAMMLVPRLIGRRLRSAA